ncbi:hypothetical protein EV211_11513 [Aminicella lysinilytica]|uniref:Uncharacterized protein n=1 Tax=Aminicella lysinilytica TaxID=433323 RepID=A0A4R6Q2I1_9FIRM|nr:hypothetical protein EV211_11513 [Aminicella lysinilytica]
MRAILTPLGKKKQMSEIVARKQVIMKKDKITYECQERDSKKDLRRYRLYAQKMKNKKDLRK